MFTFNTVEKQGKQPKADRKQEDTKEYYVKLQIQLTEEIIQP